jgi:DNA-binding HxlR family transcriptional regulator
VTVLASGTPGPNAIGSTLGLLGDEWSLQIVRYALAGARRFGDWRVPLGISDAVLAGRLRALVDGGVLERVRYSERPPRDEYLLTESGAQLWPVLVAIWSWERRFVPGQRDALPEMVHRCCGARSTSTLHCGTCHGRAAASDVHLEIGPSGAFERSVPLGGNRRRTVGVDEVPGRFRHTMEVLGSRWSSAVLGAAFLGASRFVEFERMLGAPPSVLTERLTRFVDLGVFDVDRSAGGHGRYVLSIQGAALFDVVATMLAWGERWKGAPEGPAVVATHGSDAHPFVPELACSACDAVLHAPALEVRPADRMTRATASEPVVAEL